MKTFDNNNDSYKNMYSEKSIEIISVNPYLYHIC